MLETNSITISVENDVVNYAKANTQGVIEIPNRIWNTIISNVTFPERSFFNKLFINVSELDDVEEEELRVQDKTIDITTNGTRTVTPDVGYQGLGEVTINTNVPSGVNNQNKSLVVNSNGLQIIKPDSGYSGIGELSLNVDVQTPSQLVIQQVKSYTLTSVNTIARVLPDEGYNAMYEVDVSVDVSNLLKTLSLNITSDDLVNGRVTLFGNIQQPNIGWSSYNINVNVPQPNIQDNDVRYIVPSNEAREIIVEPNEGYDALKKVTLNVASATLVTDQNILSLTSNGTFSLPSLSNSQALGFADSCTVNVNVKSNKKIIDRFLVGYHTLPNGGSFDSVSVNLTEFEVADGNHFSASQQYGYIFVYESSGIVSVGFVVPNDNNGITINANISKVYYYELGPAIYVRLMNFYENDSFVGEVISSNVVLGSLVTSRFRKEMMSCTVLEE